MDKIPCNLIDKYKSYEYDNQLFNHDCYCEKKINGVDLIAKAVTVRRCSYLKVALADLSLRRVGDKGKLTIEEILHVSK